ncbi:hypothetical protein LMG26857_03527 [Achromobacter anxifer]|uniref:HD domain-containing protein n=1 Tax=Achromobacter anxifer TaxID=1287737 RepID=UPI00155C3718|nr:HD domain-containing protein [Achromobacter anxifer]CAB5514468.1 hypothetical protein LMG26857_03527 [Achromobacter anxifer]
MQKVSGPINTQAFIAYARQHKPFEEAYNLATKLYAKQKRDFTGIKYISHPSTVAALLLDYQLPAATMVAAVLEDTLSRTSLKPATIEKLFGAEVLALVQALTPGDQRGAEALKEYGERIRAAGYQAQTVKIVSVLDHLCAIPANRLSASIDNLEAWTTLLPYLSGGNAQLLERLTAALRRARA